MTAYTKNLLAWLTPMAIGYLLIIAALYVSSWFALPVLGLVFGVRFIFERITCPNCGEPVTRNTGRGAMATVRIVQSIFSRKCLNCGSFLDQRENGHGAP